jgi:hypothetical protein
VKPKQDLGLFRRRRYGANNGLGAVAARTCKGATYKAEARCAACKGGSAVRIHAGGLYDARSYCYTLAKC